MKKFIILLFISFAIKADAQDTIIVNTQHSDKVFGKPDTLINTPLSNAVNNYITGYGTLGNLRDTTRSYFSATSPIFYNSSTGVISSQAASGSQNGYLTSTDWTTFNNKVGVSSPTNGDMLYYNSGWQKLAIGTSSQALRVVGGL